MASHPDSSQSHQTRLTARTYSEWTQWDEAKSARLNLWAAQVIVQLQNAKQYNWRAALAILYILLPTKVTAQMWPRKCQGTEQLQQLNNNWSLTKNHEIY